MQDLSIGEVARRAGLRTSALRYYALWADQAGDFVARPRASCFSAQPPAGGRDLQQ